MQNICEICGRNTMDGVWPCDECFYDEERFYDEDYSEEEEYFALGGDDVVNKPSHYTRWVIEPITYIMRNGMEFWRGNVIKYGSRAGFKVYDGMTAVESEVTDLKKVIRYCEMRINQITGETEL